MFRVPVRQTLSATVWRRQLGPNSTSTNYLSSAALDVGRAALGTHQSPQHWTALCTPPRLFTYAPYVVAPFLPELKKSMRIMRNFLLSGANQLKFNVAAFHAHPSVHLKSIQSSGPRA